MLSLLWRVILNYWSHHCKTFFTWTTKRSTGPQVVFGNKDEILVDDQKSHLMCNLEFLLQNFSRDTIIAIPCQICKGEYKIAYEKDGQKYYFPTLSNRNKDIKTMGFRLQRNRTYVFGLPLTADSFGQKEVTFVYEDTLRDIQEISVFDAKSEILLDF